VKLALALAAILAVSCPICGQQSQPFPTGGPGLGVAVLSDTEGVDFHPYILRLLAALKANWISVMPKSAETGEVKVVFITFQIAPNGGIGPPDPVLERTSGDQAFDDAAISAIRASSPFEALPLEFDGPYLKLRIAFIYNYRENQPTPKIRVSADVAAARIDHLVEPVYPKDANVQGTVVLHAIIDTDGSVESLEYVSGPTMLMRAALDAAHVWHYRPMRINGEPVKMDTTINVVFALDRQGHLKLQPRVLQNVAAI